MKLNDFQYNWYLHFEEENEKSIVGLPFDPYFEAHKYDSETILDYVPKARRKSKLGVLLLGIVSDCFDPIMEIPNCLKPFGSSTLKAIDEFCESVHRENWLLMVSWLAGVFSLFYLYGPIENNAFLGHFHKLMNDFQLHQVFECRLKDVWFELNHNFFLPGFKSFCKARMRKIRTY